MGGKRGREIFGGTGREQVLGTTVDGTLLKGRGLWGEEEGNVKGGR